MSRPDAPPIPSPAGAPGPLDVERDSDVPISTQIYWQLAYQIDSGRLLPGARLLPVRELGAALRVNPNTIRAVYRRLADAGYVTSRHGAGTHVTARPPQRRGAEALAGIVAEMIRRAAHAGFTAGRGGDRHVRRGLGAQAARARSSGSCIAECTSADAGYDAERLVNEFPGLIEAEGALLDDVPDRLDRFHYDLVATTTFHGDEAQALVAGRVPVVAMVVGPGYVELVHEIAGLPRGSRVGLICASERGTDNIRETLNLAGTRDVDIVSAVLDDDGRPQRRRPDRRPHPDVARGARGRPGATAVPARADPGVELRVRSLRPGVAAAGDRPRGGHHPGPGGDLMRDFHVQRLARSRYGVDGALLGVRGDLVVTDVLGVRRLADRMNEAREPGAAPVSAGEIAALGLIHEIGHLLIARYEADRRPNALTDALATLDTGLGARRRAPARPIRPGVPRHGPRAGATARPARGAAAHPRRQREPGHRTAARTRRRSGAGSLHALHRGDRPTWSPPSPKGRPSSTAARRCSRSCELRLATHRPRWPVSSATSATTGARSCGLPWPS